MTPGNDRRTILTFTIIAFLILGMACVNFTNLATARASQRAREVALRKVLGANRQQLITQFLAESVLIAGIAMLLALALVELLLPALSNFLDADRSRCTISARTACCCRSSVLTLLVGAAGGLYPAFYLSPLPAGAGAQGQQIVGRGVRASGLLRNVAGRRPVRGLDRAHHLHRGGLRADRLRAHRRSRLPARRPDPGRESRPAPAARPRPTRSSTRSSACPASPRSAAPGSASPPRTTAIPASRCRARREPVNIGTYSVDHGLLPDDGHPARRRPPVRPRTGRSTTLDLPFPSTSGARAGAGRARGVNVVINELAARRMGFRNPGRRGRQDRAASRFVDAGIRRWCRPASSASSAIRASARSASRSIRSCSGSTAPAPAPC